MLKKEHVISFYLPYCFSKIKLSSVLFFFSLTLLSWLRNFALSLKCFDMMNY